MEEIRLSLKREEVSVTLETVDGGEHKYVLREMVGRDRDMYLTKMGDRMKFSPSGKVIGIKTFDGLQSSLLSLCLYDDADALVSAKDIQAFPTKTLAALFKVAQEINALNQEDAEEASKNAFGENE